MNFSNSSGLLVACGDSPRSMLSANRLQTLLAHERNCAPQVGEDERLIHRRGDPCGRPAIENQGTQMPINNNIKQSKKNGTLQNFSPSQAARPTTHLKLRRTAAVLLLILLIFAALRLIAVGGILSPGQLSGDVELLVRTGNQQVVTIDLRQSVPVSPDLLGTNIFPQSGTSSEDKASGSMDYSPPLPAGLTNAHIKLLRFPGGKWGEDHLLSFDQLSAFSTLLAEMDANGMLQARLSGPIKGNFTNLTGIASRAAVAGRWVDFLNNPHSTQRTGKYAHIPYHPVKYWTVGNEPDTLINPSTGQKYLVSDYVNDFIQFSTVMHRNDPQIKVFGPEISQYYGPGAGPTDAHGQPWMEGFLKGVGAYEKAHNVVLLDGVSFHSYQFSGAVQAPYMFLSSTGEWNYLLPALHQLISQDLRRDAPVAVTEINTNPAHQQAPSRGVAALWWGDTLATLMNQQVEYVAFASATDMDTPYPLFTSSGQQPTPMSRVMELFTHLQRNLIPLGAQRDPVSLYATQDDTHQLISLLFINKANTPQLVQISGGENLLGTSSWNSLNLSLAGYSMVVVTLHRSSYAEAYSFNVPTGSDPATAAVIHTLCGHKTDTLNNAIPC